MCPRGLLAECQAPDSVGELPVGECVETEAPDLGEARSQIFAALTELVSSGYCVYGLILFDLVFVEIEQIVVYFCVTVSTAAVDAEVTVAVSVAAFVANSVAIQATGFLLQSMSVTEMQGHRIPLM